MPRPYKDRYGNEYWTTSSKHLESTIIPNNLNGYNITAIKDYKEFLNTINRALEMAAKVYNAIVYFKGFGLKHDYDYELLKVNFNKYNIPTNNLSVLRNAYKDFTIPWTPTSAQVQSGQSIPNQEYLERGIIHNIEDVEELWNIVK